MWARASGPRTVSTTLPRTSTYVYGSSLSQIITVDPRVALDRPELRPVHLGVDQDVIVVGVDPHHVRHRLPDRRSTVSAAKFGRVRQLAARAA